MRVIVHGVGAIGGVIAGGLALSGQEVVGIARGAQLEALRSGGLTLRGPGWVEHTRFDCVADPSDIALTPEDVVILTVKGQDTAAALGQLRAAGLSDQPLFCAQNGVANERAALRLFPNVHGMTVMSPSQFTVPGEVAIFAGPRMGIFDLGRYPGGADAADEALAGALNRGNFAAFVATDVMASKYGKLLLNLRNICEAALGDGDLTDRLAEAARAEARQVLQAAGIGWQDVGLADPRRKEFMQMAPVEGVGRAGTSTAQSLARGAGSIETDYLNGEIALIGRLNGIEAPVNGYLAALGARMLREGIAPGAVSPGEVAAVLGL
ncbi:ketopantoate reductase family protein [Pseudodonghicola flavimaris]|uniref:2-dehydropantoate 2-reductase n=1 Tax=Pseudodonghicola flavimaris TaxID=3050036 RepID=A0ABT7F5W4_9RHOB|nr:2-dehydropantoate 2-reductase N-terminal domain-containing protein [Pseudodonghicola flavimaris]MDK3019995.1 2-dehydropantoate 2-reductase N-terminal domain-containing protein [Pseudodonghicola flavimaris]